MKAIKFILFAMVAMIFASCAGVNVTTNENNVPETKIILKESNYKIVGEATGEWSASYILGVGGLYKKSLTTNAISEMYKNAQLKGNQQIINVTTTTSVEAWAIFYVKYRTIAHGYIIEFEE